MINNNNINVTKAGCAGKDSSSHFPLRYGLYGLAFAIALLAAMVWPSDHTLSDLFSFFVPNKEHLLLRRAALPLKLFGKGEILFVLGLVLAIRRWKKIAVSACLALILTGLIVLPTKLFFERTRPSGTSAGSFPSGDAAAITAFMVPVAAAFPRASPIAVAGIATIGVLRIAFKYHFPSDVLAGIAIGLFAGATILSLKISLGPRIRRFLRRSWLAAFLGLFVLIRIPMASGGNMREFLPVFGPAVAFLVIVPFARVCFRSHRQTHGISSNSRGWKFAIIVSGIIFASLLFSTTRSTLWGRDETHFSEATVEMVRSGNYLVPTFNGELRPDNLILNKTSSLGQRSNSQACSLSRRRRSPISRPGGSFGTRKNWFCPGL